MSHTKSGTDIAHVWYDSWKGTGHPNFNDCHIDDTWPAPGSSYVQCNTFLDYDYEWSALLRVNTVQDAPGLPEVVDMLAVIMTKSKLNVAWRNEPRHFFDQDSYWLEDARLWFVDLDHSVRKNDERD